MGTATKPKKSDCFPLTKSSGITAYYINMDEHTDRKKMMESQFNKMGIPFKRIPAITPTSPEYNLLMLEQPCKRNSPRDFAVIMSHLKAIYTAVFDPIKPLGQKKLPMDNYALILEDDARFLYDIDYRRLVDVAPRKFGMLQLITSNPEAVDSLWYNFNVAQCSNSSETGVSENVSSNTPLTAGASVGSHSKGQSSSAARQKACADLALIEKNYKPKAPPKKKKKEGWNEDDYVPPPKQFELTPARLHDLAAAKFWKQNNWNDFSRNGRSALYWSAQAYLINKRTAWRFLNDIVDFVPVNSTNNVSAQHKNRDGKPGSSPTLTSTRSSVPLNAQGLQMGFKLVNSFTAHSCQRRKERPCILASCMYAYSYIFSAGQPTHVAQIPLFAGSKLGINSTLHADHFGHYKKAFAKIKAITADMKGAKNVLLPPYIEVAPKYCFNRTTAGV